MSKEKEQIEPYHADQILGRSSVYVESFSYDEMVIKIKDNPKYAKLYIYGNIGNELSYFVEKKHI